ncbi:MAG TPA: GNAT family N-acetyltransferase [Anaerolineaceae bacterium]
MDFTLHNSFSDLNETEWNTLLGSAITNVPFLRYEYLNRWWQTGGGGEWNERSLALVAARQAGLLVGIAPLFHTPNHQGIPRLMLLGSIEISDYLDLIVSQQHHEEFCTGLLNFLSTAPLPPWDALDLYNLLENSPTLTTLAAIASRANLHVEKEKLQHCPYIPLPGDWDIYLAGIDKKQRHEIRRKIRRAEESGIPLRWYIVSERANLDDEIQSFLDLMSQDAPKAAFLTPAMRLQMKTSLAAAFDAGYLSLAFLEIGGQKAAAYLNFDYLNRIWVYNSGVNRSLMEYSPGWVLLGYLLQWANQTGKKEFDFMRGDEEYKYRFGGVDRFVWRMILKNASA